MDIGKSTEGHSLKVIKIGTPTRSGRVKPAVWIDGGFHAREWISSATVLYFVHQFVERSNNHPHPFILKHLDIYILPCANPDG